MYRVATKKMLTPVASLRMTAAMGVVPQSLDDLVFVSGLSKQTVTRFVKELTEANMAHVGAWARDRRGYPTIRRFAMGGGPDAACPVRYSGNAERMRVTRAAKKAGVQCPQSLMT
jgi:hypothetical protein